MPVISIKVHERDLDTLDKLVIAVRAYYERQVPTCPPAAALARNTTRSSAIRDLLSAWDHDIVSEFSHQQTE